ncbi:MAG: OmpA family protein [Nitrosomonas sp.]|nr:OmpA family protein [Nitrosomonas sp.]
MRIRTIFVLFALNILIFPIAIAQENKLLRENEATFERVDEGLSFRNNNSSSENCQKKHSDGECIRTRGGINTQSEVGTRIMNPELNDQPPVSASKNTARLSILLTFETNSAELTNNAKQALNSIALTINKYAADSDFVIEGHADVRGTYELNQHLSEARAESVRNFLIRTHGIDPNLLRAIGKSYTELFNKENPTAPENRRVAFIRKER